MNSLGLLLKDSDPELARRWFEKAAEAGNARAMNNLGALLKDSDPGQARRWYEKAAEAGHTVAMNNLGALLEDSDPGQARRWFEKAAEAGNARAMVHLGLLLDDSDPGQARRWFEKAAEAGDSDAWSAWGRCSETATQDRPAAGMRRPPPPVTPAPCSTSGASSRSTRVTLRAARWYEKAAAAGDPGAMLNLGVLLDDRVTLGHARLV